MQWLNKVDDALDWVLGPAGGGEEEGDGDEIARAAAEAVQSSTQSSSIIVDRPTSLPQHGIATSTTNNQSASAKKKASVLIDIENSTPGGSPQKKKNDTTISTTANDIKQPPLPSASIRKSPIPPPPPPKYTTPTKKNVSMICPTNPLATATAMLFSDKVLDDSHELSNNNNSLQEKVDIDDSKNGVDRNEAFVTAKSKDDMIPSLPLKAAKKAAESTVIQQQATHQTPVKQQQQAELHHQLDMSTTYNSSSSRSRVYSNTEQEQKAPTTPLEHLAISSSPAPKKVIMRGRSSNNDITNSDSTDDMETSNDIKVGIPPPPPLPVFKEVVEDVVMQLLDDSDRDTQQQQQQQQPQQTQQQNVQRNEVPKSPSNFIIELPIHQQQQQGSDGQEKDENDKVSPMKMPRSTMPLPPPLWNKQPGITTSNSNDNNNKVITQQQQQQARQQRPAPRSTTAAARRGRGIVRPTPGVIRRKIREPSISPPDSPSSSSSSSDNADVTVEKNKVTASSTDNTTTAAAKHDIPLPLQSVTLDNDDHNDVDRGISELRMSELSVVAPDIKKESKPPPPPPPPPNRSDTSDEWNDNKIVVKPTPPLQSKVVDESTKAKADRAVSDVSSDDWNDNKKSSPTPTVIVSPPNDHITLITQNRKSSTVVQQRKTTLSSDLTFDDELKTKQNVADHTVLTKTKKDDSSAESSIEVDDKEEEVSGNEGVADTITNWFSRMGSTDGGKKKDQSIDDDKKDDDKSDDEDSFHSQHSNDDSELTGSNEADDFAIPSPSYTQIQQQQNDLSSWDSSLNRYGFFHVRLLRAQRLPCAPGSSINTTLSLQPWTGRIVIPTYVTSDGPRGAGVCLRWDKPFDQKKKQRRGGGSKGGSSKDGESPEVVGEECSHSMVHAYNNEDTPVPKIYLELSISTLGGLRDSYMCSVSIPCHDLLRNPRSWTHKWYPVSLTQGSDQPSNEGVDDTTDTLPLILLETCFEPKETRTTAETVDETEQLVHISEDDTLGSIPQVIRQTTTVDDESVLTSTIIPRNPKVTKSHLLRVKTFWTPAWCAVCSKSLITGWSSGKSFECEACSIFCCRDCQLQVDARIPCGSELAIIAVKKAQQYQIPSFGDIMTKVAPKLDEEQDKTSSDGVGDSSLKQQQLQRRQSSLSKLKSEGRSIEGIGIMNIRVLRACLFDKTFPSEAEPSELFKSDYNLRNGDHYVRVSWLGSKETKRTKTVLQTPKPLFDSEEMIFDVPHYGMEYKLEVIDANTDKPIGSCLLSAQGLLQWQRDELLAKKERLLLSFLHLKRYSEPRRIKLELRTGVKDGFGLNFYNSAKSADGPNKQRPGEISGWLELDVHLEEDRQLFYSATPRRCPDRAEEEFDIALIQLHIARITAIFESMQKMVSTYMYVVGWEDQRLTGGSLVIFVVLTLGFNLEYLGSLPVGCLVLYMMRLAYLRVTGQFKDRWTMQEKEALIKSETKIEKNQSIFRPLGLLHVGDLRGKNLRSRDLGLPGSFYASIMYDPLRYAPSDKAKASLIKMDSSSGCTHEVGTTISPGITSNPVWEQMQESTELMRLKHLLPNDRIWGQKEDMDMSLSYPILQPLTDGSFISNDDDEQAVGLSLMPWEQSFGAVVIQVRFSDVLGMELFDNTLGEVVIPLAKLAGSGRAVEGWFRLLSVGTIDTIPGEESPDESAVELEGEESETESEEGEDLPAPVVSFPELYVNIKFSSNALSGGDGMTLSDDMESFKVICEEMSRTASIAQSNSIGVIGSSLNTINTVRTLGGKLQNQISVVVDMVERVRNAFNFSNPRITVFIFLCLSLLWVVLAFIPTRIVILFGGLGQFGATYYMKFMMQPTKKKTMHMDNSGEEESSSTNIGNPLENLFLSIPTDEDLRRTYFWEARRLGEKEREKFASTKRQTRLDKLWKAKWHGALEIKERRGELQPESSISERTWGWEPAFGLIEGHRFIWWRSERHFDTGEAPLGQIFFAGHSGLAGLSPLDLRELSKEEVPKVVSIFGRGTKEQQKITFLAPSATVKDSLENAVIDASMNAKVD